MFRFVLLRRFAAKQTCALLVSYLFLYFVFSAHAQQMIHSIVGQILDQNGAVVSAATVTLTPHEPTTNTPVPTQTAQTDSLGRFHFPSVMPGTYRLIATGEGFAAASRTITVEMNAQTEANIVLSLSQIAEDVVVTSAQIIGDTESQRRIPGTVDVLDRRTLEASRVFTFTEALRKIPGINVRDEEGFGLRPNIGIRGLNPTRSTKVLLLEDGIPLTYAPYGDNASYYVTLRGRSRKGVNFPA